MASDLKPGLCNHYPVFCSKIFRHNSWCESIAILLSVLEPQVAIIIWYRIQNITKIFEIWSNVIRLLLFISGIKFLSWKKQVQDRNTKKNKQQLQSTIHSVAALSWLMNFSTSFSLASTLQLSSMHWIQCAICSLNIFFLTNKRKSVVIPQSQNVLNVHHFNDFIALSTVCAICYYYYCWMFHFPLPDSKLHRGFFFLFFSTLSISIDRLWLF